MWSGLTSFQRLDLDFHLSGGHVQGYSLSFLSSLSLWLYIGAVLYLLEVLRPYTTLFSGLPNLHSVAQVLVLTVSDSPKQVPNNVNFVPGNSSLSSCALVRFPVFSSMIAVS